MSTGHILHARSGLDEARTSKYIFQINDSRTLKLEYSFEKEQSILVVELVILIIGIVIRGTGLYDRIFFLINYGLIICLGYVLNMIFPNRSFID
ncbi:MAG: hypothetical protein DWP94_12135 [Flavobacterium sp.]|nr:MAG: hypothetical protein DWP94_12135 [Flavobacterium sp.]